MVFPKSASQDASVEYTQSKMKICDFFHLGAFGCFLTHVKTTNSPVNIQTKYSPSHDPLVFHKKIHDASLIIAT